MGVAHYHLGWRRWYASRNGVKVDAFCRHEQLDHGEP